MVSECMVLPTVTFVLSSPQSGTLFCWSKTRTSCSWVSAMNFPISFHTPGFALAWITRFSWLIFLEIELICIIFVDLAYLWGKEHLRLPVLPSCPCHSFPFFKLKIQYMLKLSARFWWQSPVICLKTRKCGLFFI